MVMTKNSVPVPGSFLIKPGTNLRTGENDLSRVFGPLLTIEKDALRVASAIYACDLAFRRGEREEFTRAIELTIPVVNRELFNSVREEITYALYTLSDDTWQINFTQDISTNVTFQAYMPYEGKVLLFSGGIDSFAAAMGLGFAKENVQLVSHVTANHVVSNAQETIYSYLQNKFPGQFERTVIHAGGVNKDPKGFPFPIDEDREETQRTRSFLFLTFAAIVARRRTINDIIMIAENGQMAIHVPLTAARIGAFSTQTAHPEFINSMNLILSKLFTFNFNIHNPFLYLTKGEVVQSSLLKDIDAISQTVSCWRSTRLSGPKTHCGECIPCYIRRIANEANNILIDEYDRNVFLENVKKLKPDDIGKRNLMELA